MTHRPNASIAEVERALKVVAYIVLRHGEAYAPLLERLDAEAAELRRKESHRDRARRILSNLSLVEVRDAQVA